MRTRSSALAGSALFFLLAPATVAGILPWLIGGWRFERAFGSSPWPAVVGLALVVAGVAALVESFVRFALKGLGTPAPVAPTECLIVSGLYRHVRNPMYVAVVGIIAGQALFFGQLRLVAYAALIWTCFQLFVLHYEEPILGRQFGEEYERYKRAVPRWLPLLRPWRGGS